MEQNEESPDLASYAENSPFVRLLGKPGRVKILDVLLRKHYTDLTASQITDLAGVSPSTFSRNKEELLGLDIIHEAGDVGGTTVYTLNTDSELAQILRDAQTELFEHTSEVKVATTRLGGRSKLKNRIQARVEEMLEEISETEHLEVAPQAESGEPESAEEIKDIARRQHASSIENARS